MLLFVLEVLAFQKGTTDRENGSSDLRSVVAEKEKRKEEVVHFIASLKCWPGVNKHQQHIRALVDRCLRLENGNQQPAATYEDITEIDIYVSSRLNIDSSAIPLRADRIVEKETLFLNVSERKTKKGSVSLRQNFSGIFIDEECVKLVEAISPEQIDVIVVDGDAEKSNVPLDPDSVKHEISSFLERVVFEVLIEKYNMLKDQASSDENRIISDSDEHTKENGSSTVRDSFQQHKDTIKQLIGEMVALFKWSKLPDDILPVVTEYEEKRISNQVEEQLFHLDSTIKGCGYSYGTYNVNLESLPDEDEDEKRRKNIKDFLEKVGVKNVKFNIVSQVVSEYTFVGATVCNSAQNIGTLSCFASFTKGQETVRCGLFCRHVAPQGNDKLYVKENGKMEELGCIMQETLVHQGYDIAAAEILQQHVPKCNVKFKNSENVLLPGRLCRSVNDVYLGGLCVHLWGASSKPGYGTITIPRLSYPGMLESYIQLEDRDTAGGIVRLAAPGDSGAVVCADDPEDEYVHVISVLIGTIDFHQFENSKVKRRYISFPLQEAVEQLATTTQCAVSLEGITNDCSKDRSEKAVTDKVHLND